VDSDGVEVDLASVVGGETRRAPKSTSAPSAEEIAVSVGQ
jgi:hypothetical protein